jgi:hypothetical protein
MTVSSARMTVLSLALPIAVISAVLVLAAPGASAGGATTASTSTSAAVPIFATELEFRNDMRKLWEDHITWTRNVIISFEVNLPDPAATLPDLSAALNRLLRNQADIGDAIEPFYGADAGDQLTTLLREHIVIAGEVITAAKTGDTNGLADAQARWYANAHDIAVFLSTANPDNWPLAEMDQMLKDHLDATTAEVLARLNSDWTGDVAAYDEVHIQALGMPDMLSSGIVAQFPKRFKP